MAYGGLAALLGQRAMLAGQGMGQIAGQEWDERQRQSRFGETSALAQALQRQQNVDRSFDFNKMRDARNFNFRQRIDKRDFKFREEQADVMNKHRKNIFDRQEEWHKDDIEYRESQAKALREYREKTLGVKQAAAGAKAGEQVSKRLKAMRDDIFLDKVDDTGTVVKSATFQSYQAAKADDNPRKNPSAERLDADARIRIITGKADALELGREISKDQERMAHNYKKLKRLGKIPTFEGRMRGMEDAAWFKYNPLLRLGLVVPQAARRGGESLGLGDPVGDGMRNAHTYLTQDDLNEYVENHEEFVNTYRLMKIYAEITGEPQYRQDAEEMRAHIKYYVENFGDRIPEVRLKRADERALALDRE